MDWAAQQTGAAASVQESQVEVAVRGSGDSGVLALIGCTRQALSTAVQPRLCQRRIRQPPQWKLRGGKQVSTAGGRLAAEIGSNECTVSLE
jgi:hypothetical protein